jgi:hypothetical protein
MTDLYMTALEVQRLCERQRWPFCIIGGVAVLRWGAPDIRRMPFTRIKRTKRRQ